MQPTKRDPSRSESSNDSRSRRITARPLVSVPANDSVAPPPDTRSPPERKSYDDGPEATTFLEAQHREVATLFERIEKADTAAQKDELFKQVADSLAIHAAIEEHHLYRAIKARRMEDIFIESMDEHLEIKRLLADMLAISATDPSFADKLAALKDSVEHHVHNEEKDFFPRIKRVFGTTALIALAYDMRDEQARLAGTDPRLNVPDELGGDDDTAF